MFGELKGGPRECYIVSRGKVTHNENGERSRGDAYGLVVRVKNFVKEDAVVRILNRSLAK